VEENKEVIIIDEDAKDEDAIAEEEAVRIARNANKRGNRGKVSQKGTVVLSQAAADLLKRVLN
jgi:hypothetical protein